MPYTKKDLQLSLLSGFIAGLLFAGILILRETCSPLVNDLAPDICVPLTFTQLWPLAFIVPVLFLLGTWLGHVFSKHLPVLATFSKYAAVGLLNTAIDFGVLAVLIYLTDYQKGETYKLVFLNSAAFLVAVVNSYYWNRLWSFQVRGSGSSGEFAQYVGVTLIGLLLNNTVIAIGTKNFEPFNGLTAQDWALTVKGFGTIVSLIWNFVGYKFIVFRKS
ncbi:MAG: GtrA family protein [Candidatus Nomurabacteria bacterium GW2011_GWB1_47_6]|uniref:GtrA family protein n=1 Tax=Candidatus Nomurabacteria bacterium GW2011_GWB1_47_6 TaxID=1618749 RepID=A0A0G1VWT7_9BACT|nr:MAG: GtrA family protein [Candidatus Nomurabacteria bacterium GW2011_GWB1_47_6]HXK35573.1 GtrA family protein [Candidatus Paceibacterota bacterium]